MNEEKIPCSVLMLTCNSAEFLEPALKSIQRFGEILVYDGNSEDNTVEIAKRYGAEVRKQYDTDEKSVKIKDFTELYLRQRDEAKFDWVFYFDSDEFLSEGAEEEVAEVIKNADNKTLIHFLRFPVSCILSSWSGRYVTGQREHTSSNVRKVSDGRTT